jgi:hypothetical protein
MTPSALVPAARSSVTPFSPDTDITKRIQDSLGAARALGAEVASNYLRNLGAVVEEAREIAALRGAVPEGVRDMIEKQAVLLESQMQMLTGLINRTRRAD